MLCRVRAGSRGTVRIRTHITTSLPRLSRFSTSPATSLHINQSEWAAREEPISFYADDTGYLPVSFWQDLSGYTLLRKLGWGSGSTVWLAQRESDKTFAALKITTGMDTNDPQLHELDYLRRTRTQSQHHPGHSRIVRLYDHFYYPESSSGHLCMAMEPLSQNLYSFSGRCSYGRLPSGLARNVIRQVLEAVNFLHTECKIIHTDIKPENLMLAVSPEDIDSFLSSTTHARIDTALFTTGKRVSRTQSTPIAISVPPGDVNIYDSWKHVNAKLADLEMACWEDNVGDHYTQMIQSPALRAPEVCIGAGWGKPADIWSIACLAYQLSMGKSLITPNCDSDAVPFFQALYFGNLPMHMLKRGAESSKFYKDDGTLKIELPGRLSVEEMVLKQPPGRARMLVDFLKRAFVLDPEQRPTARELLAHEWVQPS